MGRPLRCAKPTGRRNRESCGEESTGTINSRPNVSARRSPSAGRTPRPWATTSPRTAAPGTSPATTSITWPNARSWRSSYAGPTSTWICPGPRPFSTRWARRLPYSSARLCTRYREAASTRSTSEHAWCPWYDSTTRDGRCTPSPSTRASSADAYTPAWPIPGQPAKDLKFEVKNRLTWVRPYLRRISSLLSVVLKLPDSFLIFFAVYQSAQFFSPLFII